MGTNNADKKAGQAQGSHFYDALVCRCHRQSGSPLGHARQRRGSLKAGLMPIPRLPMIVERPVKMRFSVTNTLQRAIYLEHLSSWTARLRTIFIKSPLNAAFTGLSLTRAEHISKHSHQEPDNEVPRFVLCMCSKGGSRTQEYWEGFVEVQLMHSLDSFVCASSTVTV
jgi:hypothetical protein